MPESSYVCFLSNQPLLWPFPVNPQEAWSKQVQVGRLVDISYGKQPQPGNHSVACFEKGMFHMSGQDLRGIGMYTTTMIWCSEIMVILWYPITSLWPQPHNQPLELRYHDDLFSTLSIPTDFSMVKASTKSNQAFRISVSRTGEKFQRCTMKDPQSFLIRAWNWQQSTFGSKISSAIHR